MKYKIASLEWASVKVGYLFKIFMMVLFAGSATAQVSQPPAPPNWPVLQGESDVTLHTSCLAGNGRIDLNIVNASTALSVYRMEFQGLTARQRTVAFEDWGRISITGRPPGTYSVVVKRDGDVHLSTSVMFNCGDSTPTVSTPQVTVVNACRANNGYVLFQMVNPSNTTRAYVIEFQGVANRSTSAAPFGQSVRGTTGRPDGVYNYQVKTGSTVVDSGFVEVACD